MPANAHAATAMATLPAPGVIPDALKALAAKEAVAFVRKVSALAVSDKQRALAEIIAAKEFDAAAYIARIIVTSKAREILRAVSAAIHTGTIRKRWDTAGGLGELITTGLSDADPRIAFQAALRTAYSAGRYARATDGGAQEAEPYFLYRTMRDGRVRDSHAVLNGVALPKSDPFWGQHYPPNGWRCRCRAYSVDAAGLAKLEAAGVPVVREAPPEEDVVHENKITGETETLPASIDPGWGFNPGAGGGAAQMRKLLEQRTRELETVQI